MLNKLSIEYPAFVYEKNGFFMADCKLYNLITIAKTETEAVENLQKTMNSVLKDYDISIKPIYGK